MKENRFNLFELFKDMLKYGAENIKDILVLLVKGIVIGIANIIPGVSGGTMALVLGVYERLIHAIHNFYKDWRNWFILVPILLGAAVGLVGFARLVSWALTEIPQHTMFFFIGLIAGSGPFLVKESVKHGFKWYYLIPFFASFGVMFAIFLTGNSVGSTEILMDKNIQTYLLLMASGAIAAGFMIVPGISGSFIMMLLGTYWTFIASIKAFDLISLAFIGVGILIGLLGCSKLIDFLLKKFYGLTFNGILGLVAGSFLVLWPAGVVFNTDLLISLGAAAAGAVIAVFASPRKKPSDDPVVS